MKSTPLKILYFALLTLLVLFYFVVNTSYMDKTVMIWLLYIVLFCSLLFFFRRETDHRLKGQHLKHSNLALIGVLIVYFQFPLDYVLDNVSELSYVWFDRKIVVKSMVLSTAGLISFFIGYLLYRKQPKKKIEKPEKPAAVHVLNILAIASLSIYFLTVDRRYLMGYYGEVNMGISAFIAIVIFKGVVFATIIQKCRNMMLKNQIPSNFKSYCKKIGWLLLALIGVYFLSVLLSGDRGPIIFYSLLLLGGYFVVTKKKMKVKYIVVLLTGGAFFITILGFARNFDHNIGFFESIEKAVTTESVNDESFSPFTRELAVSIITFHAAVAHVPSHHGYFLGTFQLKELIGAVPFLGFYYSKIIEQEEKQFQNSATYLTWVIQGDDAYYGNGTSVVSEFYLDFGLIGVICGMLFFGFLMRYLEVNMFSNSLPSLFIMIVSMVYFTNTIYIARGGLFLGLSNIFTIYLVLWLNKRLLQ